jgi:hypothetical protein
MAWPVPRLCTSWNRDTLHPSSAKLSWSTSSKSSDRLRRRIPDTRLSWRGRSAELDESCGACGPDGASFGSVPQENDRYQLARGRPHTPAVVRINGRPACVRAPCGPLPAIPWLPRLHNGPVSLRATAITSLTVALVAGMTSNVLFLAAFRFRLDWFLDPRLLIGGGPVSAELLRWAAVLDLLGYYLATGVLAYVLWRLLRLRDSVLADLTAIAATGFTLIGGAGAAVLALVGPMLIHAFSAATPASRDAFSADFALLLEVVWRSIWQLLDGLLLAAWWVGLGALVRRDHYRLSVLSFALGTAALIGVAANVVGIAILRDLSLGVVFSLWTAWWLWLLLLFVRRSQPFTESA